MVIKSEEAMAFTSIFGTSENDRKAASTALVIFLGYYFNSKYNAENGVNGDIRVKIMTDICKLNEIVPINIYQLESDLLSFLRMFENKPTIDTIVRDLTQGITFTASIGINKYLNGEHNKNLSELKDKVDECIIKYYTAIDKIISNAKLDSGTI